MLQGSGQEHDSIQELEDLWMSDQGLKRGQVAAQNTQAAGIRRCTAAQFCQSCNLV